MNDIPLIEAKNLCIGYGKKIILENLNFKLFESSMICLMGQNGSGKSTLFRVLAGLLPKLKGEVFLKGIPLASYTRIQIAQTIGLVLTDRVALPHMTVKEVLALGRYPHTGFWGKLNKGDIKIIEETIEFLQLKELKNSPYEELSDGQKQKVLLGRAVAQNTPILLLDEPMTFLDIPRKIELLRTLKKISNEKNKTILFSSHDWGLVLKNANILWEILPNKEMIMGTPEDLIIKDKLSFGIADTDFYFDKTSGDFKETEEKKITGPSIYLESPDSLFYFWTAHALKKEGFEISQNKDEKTKISICEKSQSWNILNNGQSKKVDSIELLMENLKNRI